MNIVAAFMKVDDVPCVVVQVEPKAVEDHRLGLVLQGLLARSVELQGVPLVLASKRDELSEPSFCGQPGTVLGLQKIGWRNIPFNNCTVSMPA
jgi:hypothetical protein